MPDVPSPSRTKLAKGPYVLAVLILLVFGGYSFYRYFTWKSEEAWQSYLADLRAKGELVTFANLEAARPAVPDDQNGALIIERLADELEALRDHADDFVLFFGNTAKHANPLDGIPRHVVEASRAFPHDAAHVMAALAPLRETTASHSSLRYIQRSGDPFDIEECYPNSHAWLDAALLLRLDATLGLLDGDTKRAADDILLQLCIADTLDNEPNLLLRVRQIFVETGAVRTLATTLRAGDCNHESLEELSHAFERRLARVTLKPALLEERVRFIATCDALVVGKSFGDDTPAHPEAISARERKEVRDGQLRAAARMEPLFTASDLPELLTAMRQAYAEATRQAEQRGRISDVVALVGLPGGVWHHIESVAELRCARTALAAEQFRLQTGRLPETLDELVPDDVDAIPEDPFDGQPLRLIQTDQGIIIYSIGDDERDDGGQLTRPSKRERPPDVGFRLLHTDHRGLTITDDPPPPER